MFCRLGKCTSSKQQDLATITELEKKFKSETDIRVRVESELREHQHASRNSYSAEEVRQLNEKLRKTEKDLEHVQKELARQEKVGIDLKKELAGHLISLRSIEREKQQLKISLADETRVKIELFTALSDARRKQQGLVDECHRKNIEISRLRMNLAEIMAIIPSHPSNSQPPTSVSGVPGTYPPASSPQQ